MMTIPTRRIRRARRLVAALLLSTLVLLATAPVADAASNDIWSVEPSAPEGQQGRDFFVFTLRPGQVFQDTVSVTNFTDEPLTFEIYATDAYNTPEDAAFALLQNEETPEDAGSWIQLGVAEYTVPPATRSDIPFQVAVPSDASPGDHVAGIVADNVETQRAEGDESNLALEVDQRVAARAYVRVEGPIEPAVRIDRVDVSHQEPLVPYATGRGNATVEYEITNTGNIRLAPTAELRIKGIFGRTVKSFDPVELPELLPGGSVVVTETWESLPPLERLSAEVSVTDAGEGGDVTRATSFWTVPWLPLIVVALLLIAYLVWRWWRRRQAEPTAAEPEPVHA